jgi:hypothetical protein
MITTLVVEATVYDSVHVVLIQRTLKYDGSGIFQAAMKRSFETIRKKVSGADKI